MKMLMIIHLMIFICHHALADCVTCEKNLRGHDVAPAEKLAGEGDKIAKLIATKEKGFWGNYYLKQLCGSIFEPPPLNKTYPLNSTHSELGEPISFQIGSDGFGKIESKKACRPNLPKALSLDAGKGSRVVVTNLVSIIFTLVSYGKEVADSYCEKGKAVNGSVATTPARNFFGGKLSGITKNVGFFNSKANSHLADDACNKLYASQIVNFGDRLTCIGYKNREMDEIHIYTVTPPDVYLTRMILRQKHNFNEAGVPSCPVSLKE